MKIAAELKSMLFERLAEIKEGGLTERYEEQLKIELALLYDILGEEVPEEYWEEIENHM
jgi:hypothetical protein